MLTGRLPRCHLVMSAASRPSGAWRYPEGVMATPPTVPAGWYADPSARHEHRYWDGTDWTAQVSDAGVMAIDRPAARPEPASEYPAERPPASEHPAERSPAAGPPAAAPAPRKR